MSMLDFEYEFYSEIPDASADLRVEAERQLLDLSKGHDDLIGASVTIEELTGETTPHRYEAKVLVYKRPDNVIATEKSGTPEGALRGALAAVERQVRELRTKLKETWKQP